MGFLSKAFKKVKKQIQPNNMMIGNMRNMPKRGGGFLSRLRGRKPGMISDMRFRGEMPRRPSLDFLEGRMPSRPDMTSIRMPKKSGGFGGFGNLGEAIRRLQEQRGGNLGSDFRAPRMPRMEGSTDMGMPRMNFGDQIGYTRPNKDPSMPGMIAGGTPGFYDNMRENMSPGQRLEQMPQPIPEQMPTDPSSYYNPTIFGQQMGDMDFSQMPEISPVDMSNLQMPTLPREISQMDLPQMPEGLPSMQDVQGMPQMGMRDMQPRMMMAEGDEVFMPSSPEQIAFSIEAEIKNLMNEYEMAANNGENERAMMLNEQINELEAQKIEIMNQGRAQLKGGGDFPDLTGDGKVTQADILKGRGVYAEGDEVMMMQGNEIESMLSGMDSEETGAMDELEQMAPEMEMIDQLVMMVAQMIQQGAGEEEVIMFLREQGLDDEDIGTVLQLVSEMAETEEVAAQNEIGADLEQLG
jgi:hypothetical protein